MEKLLFSPSGRINSDEFMRGIAITAIIGFVLSSLPIISSALVGVSYLSLILGWCWVVLWVKRYHDGGQSAWMCVVPIALYCILLMIVFSVVLGEEINQIMEISASTAPPEEQAEIITEIMKGKQLPMNIVGVAVSLIIAHIFNNMIKGDAEDNRFGPAT